MSEIASEVVQSVLAAQQPLSLYLSLRLFAITVPAGLIVLWFAGSDAGTLWVPGIGIALGALGWVFFADRRIDLDGEAITFVPALRVRSPQRFPFSAVGPFEPRKPKWWAPGTYPSLRAKIIDPGYSYRLAGLFRRSSLDVLATWSLAPTKSSLTRADLATLLNAYRENASRPAEPSW